MRGYEDWSIFLGKEEKLDERVSQEAVRRGGEYDGKENPKVLAREKIKDKNVWRQNCKKFRTYRTIA